MKLLPGSYLVPLRRPEWLLPAAICLLIVIGVSAFRLQQRSSVFSAEVAASRNIVDHVTGLLTALDDAETGERGFLLTGQEEYLEPFNSGAARAPKEVAALQLAVSSDPTTRAPVEAIKLLATEKISRIDSTIELFRRAGSGAALDMVKTGAGKRTMDRIRTLCEQIHSSQNAKALGNSKEMERDGKETFLVIIIGSASLVALLILALIVIGSANRQRERDIDQLRDQALMLDLANDTIFVRDDEDRITYWNQGAQRLYGWSREEALGHVTHTLFHTQSPEPLDGIRAQLLAQGYWRGELKHTRRDGSSITVASSWTLLRGDSNQLASVLEINHDVTARKAAERQSRDQASMLDLANDTIFVRDAEDRITYWNQGAQRLYGWSREEALGQVTHTLFDTQFPQPLNDIRAELLSQGHWKGELRHTRRDGSSITVASNWTLQRGDSDQPASVLEINHDITARKEAEQQLEKNQREIVERSAQLYAANQELQEFAYVASHDLKAPLRVIDNASKWLEEDLQEHLTEETRESMNLLRSRVGRMDKLLDDLLKYARIGRATDSRYAEIINGDLLVNDVLALLYTENFTVKVSPCFKGIQLCRMPLQHILSNLIGNAIKHHDKRTGCIELTAEDGGEYYAFAVKDDGPGIPAQFHDQIFKMFQTLKPRDQVEGSGMGLAMVRKHIEVFGGTLQLESAEGKGSTFRFTWPKQQRPGTEAA